LEPTNYRLRELENQLAAAQRQLGQMEQRPAILRDGRNPRLAKTAIAPGAGSYPTEASKPNTYGIVFLDSTYTQASGNQARHDTARQTEARTVAQQLLPNTYVPVGTIVEVFWDSKRWWFAWGLSDTTILTPFYLDEDLLQGEDASAKVIQWDPGTSTWTVSGDSITVWDVPNFGPADNGQRGWAIFGEGTSGRYEIISLPPSTGREIYRFRLTANLNLAGTATAKILEWNGAAYVLGADIEVIDPFPAGRWSAKTAAEGICAKIPDDDPYNDDAKYTILWVEHQPIFAHFTLTGNMTGGSATAYASDYWQGPDGNDMWARAAVFDPLHIYGHLVTGDEVMCCWDDSLNQYKICDAKQNTGREIYRFRLTANLNLAGTATAKILEWNGAAYVLGADIEVIDPFPAGRWSAKTAAEGICAKIPDDAKYNILWVEHQPIFAHFTLTGNMTGGSATATASDYWQGPDGNDMWARAAVFDPLHIYGHLVIGDEVMCCWDDSLNQYKICDAKQNEIRWGYATADWVNAPLNASKVVCQLAAGKDGPSLGGAPFDVYLPRPSGSLDPNVREGTMIGFLPTVDGFFVCVTGHLDDCIGTIKIWSGAVADIRLGWQLCDGSNGTPDLREKFVLGAVGDSGGDSDFDEEGGNTYVGQTGGLKRKLVNWEHTAFGWPLLRTFDTTQYIFQYDSFQTQKEDPPLSATIDASGTATVSGFTEYWTTGLILATEASSPPDDPSVWHADHQHAITSVPISYTAGGIEVGLLGSNDACGLNQSATSSPVYPSPDCSSLEFFHDLIEPGTTGTYSDVVNPPQNTPPHDEVDNTTPGHRHEFADLEIDAASFDFTVDLHWGDDPYDGHFHQVPSGTLDGKLIIADVTHDAPAGVPYNRHYHDFHLDNHQEYINRIPPYYALAYIMRVD